MQTIRIFVFRYTRSIFMFKDQFQRIRYFFYSSYHKKCELRWLEKEIRLHRSLKGDTIFKAY